MITLGRAGEDNKSFRLNDIDSTISGFAIADYGIQDAVQSGTQTTRTREVAGQVRWVALSYERSFLCYLLFIFPLIHQFPLPLKPNPPTHPPTHPTPPTTRRPTSTSSSIRPTSATSRPSRSTRARSTPFLSRARRASSPRTRPRCGTSWRPSRPCERVSAERGGEGDVSSPVLFASSRPFFPPPLAPRALDSVSRVEIKHCCKSRVARRSLV